MTEHVFEQGCTASAQAIAELVTTCEHATQDELMALGRAIGGLEWTDDTAPGAALFLKLIRVPFAVAIEREAPGVDLDAVLALYERLR